MNSSGDRILALKSRELSEETIKPSNTSANNFAGKLILLKMLKQEVV